MFVSKLYSDGTYHSAEFLYMYIH